MPALVSCISTLAVSMLVNASLIVCANSLASTSSPTGAASAFVPPCAWLSLLALADCDDWSSEELDLSSSFEPQAAADRTSRGTTAAVAKRR